MFDVSGYGHVAGPQQRAENHNHLMSIVYQLRLYHNFRRVLSPYNRQHLDRRIHNIPTAGAEILFTVKSGAKTSGDGDSTIDKRASHRSMPDSSDFVSDSEEKNESTPKQSEGEEEEDAEQEDVEEKASRESSEQEDLRPASSSVNRFTSKRELASIGARDSDFEDKASHKQDAPSAPLSNSTAMSLSSKPAVPSRRRLGDVEAAPSRRRAVDDDDDDDGTERTEKTKDKSSTRRTTSPEVDDWPSTSSLSVKRATDRMNGSKGGDKSLASSAQVLAEESRGFGMDKESLRGVLAEKREGRSDRGDRSGANLRDSEVCVLFDSVCGQFSCVCVCVWVGGWVGVLVYYVFTCTRILYIHT